MKLALLLFLLAACVNAAPLVSDVDWRPACDGASIEVVSDQKEIMSVNASAFDSAVIIQWAVHYVDGVPATAEFREYNRGRILEGEKAGEYSGVNKLTRIETFKWQDSRFSIPDQALNDELSDILSKAKTKVEQSAAEYGEKP